MGDHHSRSPGRVIRGPAVRNPGAGVVEKGVMSWLIALPAYKNLADVEIVTRSAAKNPAPLAVPPVRNGEPGIAVSSPLGPTRKPETVFRSAPSLVYTNVLCARATTVTSSRK